MSTYRVDEAFGPVPLWLLDSKVSDKAVRLYALLSAMRDYGNDMTAITRRSLASRLGCSEDSLDRAKVELEEAQAITVEHQRAQNGTQAPNVYTIHRSHPVHRVSRTDAAHQARTDAALSPLIDESSSTTSSPEILGPRLVRIKAGSKDGWYTIDVEARDGKGSCDCKGFQVRKRCRHINEAREALGMVPLGGRAPGRVAGKIVTPAEHDLCDAILTAFNEATSKSFAGADWRRGIIGRIREHPEVDADQHREIITFQMAHPWWTDDPTPAVIYGKGSVFDRALNSVRGGVMVGPRRYARRYGRGMTTREMLDRRT